MSSLLMPWINADTVGRTTSAVSELNMRVPFHAFTPQYVTVMSTEATSPKLTEAHRGRERAVQPASVA